MVAVVVAVWIVMDIPGTTTVVKVLSIGNDTVAVNIQSTLSDIQAILRDTTTEQSHAEEAKSLLLAKLPHANTTESVQILNQVAELTLKHHLDASALAKQYANLGDRLVIAHNASEAERAYRQWAELTPAGLRPMIADSLRESAQAYATSDPRSAEIGRLRQLAMLNAFVTDKREQEIVDTLATLGWMYREQHRFTDAARMYDEEAAITDNSVMNQAMLQLDLASLNTDQAKFVDADRAYQRAAGLFSKLGNHFWEGLTYAKTSSSLFEQHEFDKSQKYAGKGLELMMANQSQGNVGWRTAYYFPEAIFACGTVFYHNDKKDELVRAFAQGLQFLDSQGLGNSHLSATYLARYIQALQNSGHDQDVPALQKRLADINHHAK